MNYPEYAHPRLQGCLFSKPSRAQEHSCYAIRYHSPSEYARECDKLSYAVEGTFFRNEYRHTIPITQRESLSHRGLNDSTLAGHDAILRNVGVPQYSAKAIARARAFRAASLLWIH